MEGTEGGKGKREVERRKGGGEGGREERKKGNNGQAIMGNTCTCNQLKAGEVATTDN